jgi:glutamyl-tRNA synthetase
MSDQPMRLRFAPSPTGRLHVGGARTALFNWAYARRHGGTFVLRIEDTDAERSTPEHERAILEGLRWLGLDWDEGPDIGGPYAPYRQSERIERHRELARALLAAGHAYRCFCTPERLDALRAEQAARGMKPAYDRRCAELPRDEVERRLAGGERAVLRFRVPPGETRFVDRVRGEVVFQNAEVDDWVMLRADESPTYNFVVVCDDVDMRISHVFRGEEHLVNTPKQVLLYRAFERPIPEFGHLPLMLGADGKKLSKRTGDTALEDYREKGYPREAILNFLCLQGWALDGSTEIFSIDDLVANFEIADVTKGGAIFDLDKFRWLAGEYIRADSLERVAERCAPFVVAAGLMDEAELRERWNWFLEVVRGEKERIRTYAELPERIAYLFAGDEEVPYDPEAEERARRQGTAAPLLREYAAWLRGQLAAGATPAALAETTRAWVKERGLKMPSLFQPLRLALTGQSGGPDLFEVIALLGAERALRRIERGAGRLG